MKEQYTYWCHQKYRDLCFLNATYISQSFPKHKHASYCLGFVEKGAEIIITNNSKLIADKGKIILISPNIVHANFAKDTDGWSYKMLYIPSYLMERNLQSQTASLSNTCKVFDNSNLLTSLNNFHQLARRNNSIEIDNYLPQITEQVYKNFVIEEEQSQRIIIHNISKIIDHLNKNFAKEIRLEMLEEIGNLSRYQIIRAFKNQLDLTPYEYIFHLRIQKAKGLLNESYKLVDVALESGFYDQSHFSRYFKKYVGVSPKTYSTARNILQD